MISRVISSWVLFASELFSIDLSAVYKLDCNVVAGPPIDQFLSLIKDWRGIVTVVENYIVLQSDSLACYKLDLLLCEIRP